VLDIAKALVSPVVQQRTLVRRSPNATAGPVHMVGAPRTFARGFEDDTVTTSPHFGQHKDEVPTELPGDPPQS
jgi:crotonobetainyl-CoA:carnitine CoA-transferase CaiB-like acyl-CoA transferase